LARAESLRRPFFVGMAANRPMKARSDPVAGNWGSPADVFGKLEGAWALDRQVAGTASMTGTAVFDPGKDGWLAYREQGQLRLTNGQAFEAERRYLFQPQPAGFAVFFMEEPPRLFHEVILMPVQRTLLGEAPHLCADDHYLSRYEFKPDGTFSIRHIVRGPRKDYRSDTMYRRIETP
jgi:Family of unknown function (DUF6314)